MKDPQLTPEEEKRAENEIKALKLDLEYGGESFIADDAPPELVSRFLDEVARFEALHAEGKTVPIHQFAGISDWPSADELDEAGLEEQIRKIQEQLEAAGIIVDRPDHLSPRGFYRFLAGEFLSQQVVEQAPPGGIHVFSYSDFHHDGPEFIRDHVEETLLDLLNLEKEFEGAWLSETCRSTTEAMSKAEVLERIHSFRAQHSNIVPVAFQPQEVRPTEVGMYFFFLIAWEGTPAGGGEAQRHEGPGVSQIGFQNGEWWVEGIMMPGFEF